VFHFQDYMMTILIVMTLLINDYISMCVTPPFHWNNIYVK